MGIIFEREQELDAIDGASRGARSGRGSLVVFEGPAGIGKTTLLEAAAETGTDRDLLVFRGAASELEREPLGVLLRMLRDPSGNGSRAPLPRRLPAEQPEDRFAIVERLFALIAGLAERSPLLVTIDDVQWLDATSWSLLRRIAREVEDLPICLVAALRTGEPRSAPCRDALDGRSGVEILTPEPLGERAVAELAEARLGELPRRLTRALARRSGGNPLLLIALLSMLAESGFDDADPEGSVDAIVPASAKEPVAARLDRQGRDEQAVALALAVLGPGAGLDRIGAVTGRDRAQVDAALENLRAVDLLGGDDPPALAHPVLNRAVIELAGAGDLAAAREAAALALAGEGLPAAAAAQLTAPGAPASVGGEWAVDCLIEAAQQLARRGATEDAIAFLDRAIDLPDGGARGAAVLTARGRILSANRDPEGVSDLQSALELCEDPEERARIALSLAHACFHLVRLEQAATAARGAIAELSDTDRELRLQLESAALDADRLRGVEQERARALEPEVRGADTPGERTALAHVAAEAAAAGERPAEDVSGLAARAWADGKLLREAGANAPVVSFAGTTLAWCERFDLAFELVERQLAAGRAGHSPVTMSYALALRAGINLRLGALAIAEADAEEVVSELPASDPLAHMLCFGWLLECNLARGRVEEARQRLEGSDLTGEVPDLGTADFLLLSRGDVRIATGRADAALTDYEEVGRRAERSGFLNPAAFAWRSRAALALLELGKPEAAAGLAADEVERAEIFGAPRARAIALRAAALCRPRGSRERQDLQRRGLEALAGSPARLERARLGLDLGWTMLDRGDREAAVPLLQGGMDDAHHCGAEPLVEAAIDGLRAAGKRPRRPAIRGVDALTPQQLRVSQLAAAGRTNPEIAEALFLTRRTVELHLTGAYRKLGIDSRDQLEAALAGPTVSGASAASA